MLKRLLAPVAALSLAAGPLHAGSAAPAAPEPAIETAEGSEMYRGGFILPTLGILAAILIILAATDTWPFDDGDPASP